MSYERFSDADDGAGAPASPVLDGTPGGTADGAESGVGDSPRASSSTDRTAPRPTDDDATLSRGDVLATGDVSLLSGATDSLVGRSVAISSFEVEAGAAEAVPLARLRSLFLEARSGGLLAYTLALAIIAGYAMVDTGQNIFRDNAYHIGSAACRCVMVNTYLALMQAFLANGLIGYLFWYMLWHPKAGGWGTTSHEPIADTRLLAVYHKPVRLHLWFASLSVGFCIATIAGLGVIFMFMCFYGVGVGVGTILGICRWFCDDEAVTDTAYIAAEAVYDYYAEAGTIWSAVDHLYDFASWPSVYLGRQLLCAAFTCLGAQLLMHAGTLCGVLYIKRTAGRATAAAISA